MDDRTKAIAEVAVQKIREGDFAEAEKLLDGIDGPSSGSPEIMGLLGVCKMEMGRLEEAVRLFRGLLEKSPHNVPALYNLARTLQMLERHAEAEKCYLRLVTLAPDLFHAWNNLGLLYRDSGRMEDAEKALTKALSIQPSNPACLNNLAVVAEAQGRFDEAEALFSKAISMDGNHLSARFNLGCLLFRLGRLQEAEPHLLRVLREKPDDPTARFLLQSMGRLAPPSRAPARYVEKTFDDWAAMFERKLVEELSYKTPRELFEFTRPHLTRAMDILDLGCGTGLGAELYRPFAVFLAGMDCSEKMLRQAERKGLFDALYLHDIEKRWPTDRNFQLVYSADCLCYFGDLTTVFERVRQGLSSKGLFAFSVEKAAEDEISSQGYILRRTGRFAHSASYVKAALENAGLVPADSAETNLRKEEGKWVEGLLFLAKAS